MDLLKEATSDIESARKPRNITIPLALLKQDFFKEGGTCMSISQQTAYIISAADPRAEYFHVEYPDNDHNKDKKPRLWIKGDYLRSRANHLQKKLDSELYRQRSYVTRANRENLIYGLRKKMPLLAKDDPALLDLVLDLLKIDTDEVYELWGVKRQVFNTEEFTATWRAKNK